MADQGNATGIRGMAASRPKPQPHEFMPQFDALPPRVRALVAAFPFDLDTEALTAMPEGTAVGLLTRLRMQALSAAYAERGVVASFSLCRTI